MSCFGRSSWEEAHVCRDEIREVCCTVKVEISLSSPWVGLTWSNSFNGQTRITTLAEWKRKTATKSGCQTFYFVRLYCGGKGESWHRRSRWLWKRVNLFNAPWTWSESKIIMVRKRNSIRNVFNLNNFMGKSTFFGVATPEGQFFIVMNLGRSLFFQLAGNCGYSKRMVSWSKASVIREKE